MSGKVLCLHTPKRAEEKRIKIKKRTREDPGDPGDPWRGGV